MAAFLRGFLLILLPSCGILEMRQCYGVRRESKGSVVALVVSLLIAGCG